MDCQVNENMRDYLYVWNDFENKHVIASGIECADIVATLPGESALILLDHRYKNHSYDPDSGFEYVRHADLPRMLAEDIYSWGNFTWVDFVGDTPSGLSRQEVAELLFFGHTANPFGKVRFESLQNRFLTYIHDDGWYLDLYYNRWKHVAELLSIVLPTLDIETDIIESIGSGDEAYLFLPGKTKALDPFDKSQSIDKTLQEYLDL